MTKDDEKASTKKLLPPSRTIAAASSSSAAAAASVVETSETKTEVAHWLNQRNENTFSKFCIYSLVYCDCNIYCCDKKKKNGVDVYIL